MKSTVITDKRFFNCWLQKRVKKEEKLAVYHASKTPPPKSCFCLNINIPWQCYQEIFIFHFGMFDFLLSVHFVDF